MGTIERNLWAPQPTDDWLLWLRHPANSSRCSDQSADHLHLSIPRRVLRKRTSRDLCWDVRRLLGLQGPRHSHDRLCWCCLCRTDDGSDCWRVSISTIDASKLILMLLQVYRQERGPRLALDNLDHHDHWSALFPTSAPQHSRNPRPSHSPTQSRPPTSREPPLGSSLQT